ncbi:hypothetical protein ACFQ6C_26695 [Streptomyces sp. NPDC056454]|uniref:hypothetical protein n=1 Tax=Streptomyces sp. NPDC056454 TaxID=3345823 RepID=UPI00369BA6F0
MTEQPPGRRPYNAANVAYIESAGGKIVHAVWVSDPAITPEEAYANLLRRDLPYEVEIIAEATRHYRYEGAGFSGWVVTCGANFGDPIPNKREAYKQLRWAVADRFKPRGSK